MDANPELVHQADRRLVYSPQISFFSGASSVALGLRHRRQEFDGPINGERFHAYVEQFLAPTVKPGDVVILDNLGSHKGKAVRRRTRSVGVRLVFLPKYSPDLNPIEPVFAKFKTLLQKAGTRNYEAISDVCGEILAQYPPKECAAYISNAGYALTQKQDALGATPAGEQP